MKIKYLKFLFSRCVSDNDQQQPTLDLAAPQPPSHEVDAAMEVLLKTTTELRLELQQTSLELASILLEKGRRARERVHAGLLQSAMAGDIEQLQMSIEKLTEHIDFVEDVAKLVRHVTWTECAQGENQVKIHNSSLLDNAPNYLPSWMRYPKEKNFSSYS